jgi:uncharacterized cupin superfamily protein
MITDIDEVPARERAHGDIRATRQLLGRAAGAVEIGCSRWRIPPGARNAPAHVHADEEEIFHVLDGEGFAWHEGRAYAVGPGDTIVARVNAGAHTLFGGPLDVLAFGEGSQTHLTWLPRANVMWAGPRWLPLGGPHPFEAEAALGPLDLPEPETERPPWIVAFDDAEPERIRHGATDVTRRRLGGPGGARRSGLNHLVIAPGAESHPPHCHSAEEELFLVRDGDGVLRLGDEERAVRAGHIVVRPAATGVAHSWVAGPRGLTLLAYGQWRPQDACFYPRSGKVSVRGLGIVYRVEPVDYWEGEA